MPPEGGPDDNVRGAMRTLAARLPMGNERRRITAHSFRALTEKLTRGTAATAGAVAVPVDLEMPALALAEEPAVSAVAPEDMAETDTYEEYPLAPEAVAELAIVSLPEPIPAAPVPVEVEVASSIPVFGLPVFVPLAPFKPTEELEPEPPEFAAEAGEPEHQFAETVAEPLPPAAFAAEDMQDLAPVEIEPAAREEPLPAIEFQFEDRPDPAEEPSAEIPALEVAIEEFAEPIELAEPEALPAVIAGEPASAMTLPVADAVHESEAEPVRPVSPVAEKVVDAMLKTISEAVYAKPNAAERAAFLREMALLVEQEAALELGGSEPAAIAAALLPTAPERGPEPEAVAAAAPPMENISIGSALAARIGPATTLLRNGGREPDVFAKNVKVFALTDPKPVETQGADEETGDLALTLLDMMSGNAGNALPQERALAADTLLRILMRIPVRQLLTVVERVAIMQAPPPLLVAKLIRDPRPEVVAPLLERCMHITDQDLMAAASEGDKAKQRMIARRRVLSPVLADHLIGLGDPSVVLTLIRNPGASFSHDAFHVLAETASQHHGLLAPLATRADLPAPVAFELFWYVPQELRRFIFSRFLTDSETLNKILRITLATHDGIDGEMFGNDVKFPDREVIETAIEHAAAFRIDEAAQILSEIGGVCKDTAMRILADREGEPLTVILKAMGYQRGKFSRLKWPRWRNLPPRGRNISCTRVCGYPNRL